MEIWMLSFLIIFMLHNLEEIIAIEGWFKKKYPTVRKRIPPLVQKELENFQGTTSAQFAVVIFVFSVFTSAFLVIAFMTQHDFIFLGVSLMFAINIFSHPLQSLYLRSYTPGVLTSVVLIIPYYGLFFYHFYNTELFSLKSMLSAVVVMIFLIPLFLISHKIGDKWSQNSI